jgi:hypothetical protein
MQLHRSYQQKRAYALRNVGLVIQWEDSFIIFSISYVTVVQVSHLCDETVMGINAKRLTSSTVEPFQPIVIPSSKRGYEYHTGMDIQLQSS